MAVVRMKKVILAAPQNDKDAVLNFLQSKGTVQIIDLRESIQDYEGVECFRDLKSQSAAEMDYNHIKFTYEFLKRYNPNKKRLLHKREEISKAEFDILKEKIKWQEVYKKCREIDEAITQYKNKRSRALGLMETYNDWIKLDVSLDNLTGFRKVIYFLGSISKKNEYQFNQELSETVKDAYVEKVSEKKQDVNLFILCHTGDRQEIQDILKKYGFTKANIDLKMTPAEQINALNCEITALDNEMGELNIKALELAKGICDIEKVYDYIVNNLDKENTKVMLVKTGKTFIAEGWIREDKIIKTRELLESRFQDAYVSFEDPSEEDIPPVALKNNKFFEPFEAITNMYALPRPTEVDPTPVLAPFYLIFFGMMAGDIGYGAILLLATLFAMKYMDLQGESRKIVKLLFYCSIPTIFFGWVFGGFFGNAIPVTPLWINPVDKPMDVLYISVAMGIIHLFTGLGVKAYWLIKNGKLLDAVFDVFFWYVLLTGLIWMLIAGGQIPTYMSIIGAAGILLTQGRGNATIVGKLFGGIYGLYGVTSYIGDVLSYSRLLALGLATGLIGSSFNLLIKLLGGGVVAMIAGPVIFLAGHTFNLLIGMLGTFVHTCRLEYLEFFGKFYEGGGKAFQPLKIKTKFVKVNEEK